MLEPILKGRAIAAAWVQRSAWAVNGGDGLAIWAGTLSETLCGGERWDFGEGCSGGWSSRFRRVSRGCPKA